LCSILSRLGSNSSSTPGSSVRAGATSSSANWQPGGNGKRTHSAAPLPAFPTHRSVTVRSGISIATQRMSPSSQIRLIGAAAGGVWPRAWQSTTPLPSADDTSVSRLSGFGIPGHPTNMLLAWSDRDVGVGGPARSLDPRPSGGPAIPNTCSKRVSKQRLEHGLRRRSV
jgi:hypothetical protein